MRDPVTAYRRAVILDIALHLAMVALDLGPGDEVITSPFTFFATAGTIHNVGATPVFVDIDPKTYNIRPDLVAAAVTPRTKAVIPVDLFGQMAPIEEIRRLLPTMPIIEDAAQSIGARRKIEGEWTMAGQKATIGTFSFFPSKNLGGYGDGGMMVTQDQAIADRLMKLRVHGGARTYYHDEVGFNSRLDARALWHVVKLGPEQRDLLKRAADRWQLSARSSLRVLKVARTLADLAGSAHVTTEHVAEALQLRCRVRGGPG